jgi:hypothetical protein
MAENRVTTEYLEALRNGPANARVTTVYTEVLESANNPAQARVTTVYVEVLRSATGTIPTAGGRFFTWIEGY